jgi:hypothetical protein
MSWAMADNTPIDADLPEAVKSWNEEYAFPKLRIASATEIVKTFEDKYGDQIPVLKGDFTEYWTDGTGSASKQTSMNRSSKERLVQAEILWSMYNEDKAVPRSKFNDAWKNIYMGSEHTWCYMAPNQEPISSDILKVKFNYFQQAENYSHELLSQAISSIKSEKSSTIAVINTLSWSRDGIVTIPYEQSKDFDAVYGGDGRKVKYQILSTGEIVFKANDIPSFGSKKYYLKNNRTIENEELAKDNILDNGIIRIEIDQKSGDISSFKYKGIEYVDTGASCSINSFRYLKGDDDPGQSFIPRDVTIKIKENGPLLATLMIESIAEGCNKLTREVTIYDEEDYIDIKNIVDKVATTEKEGIHFGFAFNIDKPKLIADIPWGMIEIEKDQLYGANRNWITLQRWLNISNDKRGITWCPIDAPMFQVGDIRANIIGSGTNSEKWIRKLEPDGIIYSWALNNHWHTNFPLSQEGEITFRYRIKPHLEGYNYDLSNRFSLEQYRPMVIVPVNNSFEEDQLLSIDGSPLVFATILKTSNDGKSSVLRLRSLSDIDEKIELSWLARIPASVHLLDIEDGVLIKEVESNFIVPARDFVTIKILW